MIDHDIIIILIGAAAISWLFYLYDRALKKQIKDDDE